MLAWFEDNIVGKVLAGVSGLFVLVMLLLAYAWSLPPRGA